MISKIINGFRYLNARLLQRVLVLFSLPLFATACQVTNQVSLEPTIADTTRPIIAEAPEKLDTIMTVKADSLLPVYEGNITVQPCYGAISTPIFPSQEFYWQPENK